MRYKLDIKYQDNMILVSVSGDASYSERIELFSSIVEACEKYNCKNILTSANLSPMSLITAYDHEKIYKAVGLNSTYRLAWFVEDFNALSNVEYSAAVCRNRNLLVGFVFSDYDEAKQWLISNSV